MTPSHRKPPEPSRTAGAARPAVSEADLPAVQRRITTVLVAKEMLGSLGVPLSTALTPTPAAEISGTESLSGLATTAAVVGAALAALPLAALANTHGRRAGLLAGYATATLGAGLVVLAVSVESFPLLLLGMAAFGTASSAGLQGRFAAADLAPPERRARAISAVVWASTVGAVVGPNLTAPAGEMFAGTAIPAAAGPFVWAAAVFTLTGTLIAVLLRPDPLLTARALGTSDDQPSEGPLWRAGLAAVKASPRARLALLTLTVCHTTMISIMVMTPVELAHHGADLDLVGLVVSCHIGGMFAFSPLMGRLADRAGRLTGIGLAAGLLPIAALVAGTASGGHAQSAAGLFLLGLGWSAGTVAGSALLTDSVPLSARAAAQGLSSLAMSAAAAIGSVLAGLVMAQAGYGLLSTISAALLLPVAALLMFTALRHRPAPQ
ncbi:MFS transporter [Streptomyces sp. NPDC004126]|uniref:MFS transporter n=1 Tax=Streptomyces sp. NPDC004126 TaxID=3390695 RepID=UPI003D034777